VNGATFRLLGALAVLLGLSVPTGAETVAGPARLIDGDTIDIDGRRIRLHGIDAPETGQSCTDHRDRPYRCGDRASDALDQMIRGRRVTCDGDETDRYGRLIAVCQTGGVDLNRAMVRSGWAVAFRRYAETYLAEELEAQKANRGLWRGHFERPEEHRAQQWALAEQKSPEGCPIKGNISRNGRIYHVPWSRWYARTRISPGKGERWFCTEAEAIAAGWRAPIR